MKLRNCFYVLKFTEVEFLVDVVEVEHVLVQRAMYDLQKQYLDLLYVSADELKNSEEGVEVHLDAPARRNGLEGPHDATLGGVQYHLFADGVLRYM